MRVRCGSCGTEVDVSGEGRFTCPTCGAVNQVPGQRPPAPTSPLPTGGSAPPAGFGQPPAPAALASPSPRVTCSNCDFSFIVGDVEVAVCPNCNSDVPIGE